MHRRSLVLALLLASTGVLAQPESLYQQAVNAERDAESLKWHNAARVLGGGPPLIGDFPNPRGR